MAKENVYLQLQVGICFYKKIMLYWRRLEASDLDHKFSSKADAGPSYRFPASDGWFWGVWTQVRQNYYIIILSNLTLPPLVTGSSINILVKSLDRELKEEAKYLPISKKKKRLNTSGNMQKAGQQLKE